MLTYLCAYRKYFQAETWDEVFFKIPMSFGYAAIAGAMSMDGFLLFSGVKVEGFLKAEIERLMQEKKQ